MSKRRHNKKNEENQRQKAFAIVLEIIYLSVYKLKSNAEERNSCTAKWPSADCRLLRESRRRVGVRFVELI